MTDTAPALSHEEWQAIRRLLRAVAASPPNRSSLAVIEAAHTLWKANPDLFEALMGGDDGT